MNYEAWRISYQSSEQAARAAYAECVQLHVRIEALEKERDELRAKIEHMEKQAPAAEVESWTNGSYSRNYKLRWLKDVAEGDRLYALPGAQPAPSISPVALRHVIQWLRNGCDPVRAADELEMLAAAPEAKS